MAKMSKTSKMSASNKFKFEWWMAIVLIGVIAIVGIGVRLLSHAGGAIYDANRAYTISSDGSSLTIVQFKQKDFSKLGTPSSSEYATSTWVKKGTYPGAGTTGSNTVTRWVKLNTLDANGNILGTSKCATVLKVKTVNGVPSFTNLTADPSYTSGDNVWITPSTDCNSPLAG